jgi:hypothetical protein
MRTSRRSADTTSLALPFCAEASPARTSASPGEVQDSPASARASGPSSRASSPSSRPRGSSSRTSRTVAGDGCPRCGGTCATSDILPVPSEFLPPTSARPTSGGGSSLWPTPTASRYGSGQNGCPGDGRERYAGAGKASLETMARTGRWPLGVTEPGYLDPAWVIQLMGFPEGWLDAGQPVPTKPPLPGKRPGAARRPR